MSGICFNIQHFSIYDGPGTRTVVFFKGCNLRCKWCHNPESLSVKPQVMFYGEKCIGCGKCVSVCPNGAVNPATGGIDRDKCVSCLKCADTCYAEALVVAGEEVTVDYICRIVEEQRPYYGDSGGVTFSGGEAMLQLDFLHELLQRCKGMGVHTAVDTAGNLPYSSFEKILDCTDLFLYDIKLADSDLHKQYTGVGNELILENLRKLKAAGKQIHIRIPFIKEVNGGELSSIADIVAEIAPQQVQLIPYHTLGNSKYIALGADYREFAIPTDADIAEAAQIFANKGINLKI